ncbi:MAG: hypothetical protein QM679_07135 [Patulibacter sp.]
MDALVSQFLVLAGLIVVTFFLLTQALGLRSRRFGWLFLLAPAWRGRLRGDRGRFISTRHLRNLSPLKVAVFQALAAAGLAQLAVSASVLASLGFIDEGNPVSTTISAAVIVGGICVLLGARLLGEVVGVLAVLGVSFVVTLVSNITSPFVWVELGLLVGAAVTPVAGGVILLGLSLMQIEASYGREVLILAIVLGVVVGTLGELIEKARQAAMLTAVVGLTLAVLMLTVVGTTLF